MSAKGKGSTMLKKHVLKKTYFIPMKHMRKVIECIEEDTIPFIKKKHACDNNLYILQRTRQNTFDFSAFGKSNWMAMFALACHKALYAHNWDKLLYLLKKFPKWKFAKRERLLYFDSLYTRYLTLLLMYHPSSQAQGLLCEYFHMTWGCRNDQDKKAILKVLLHLPKRLPQPFRKWNRKTVEEDESD